MERTAPVGPAEVELGERIAAEGNAIAVTLPVLSLDKLKAVVRRGALVLTRDTGPWHRAVAFGRPVVWSMCPQLVTSTGGFGSCRRCMPATMNPKASNG